MQTSIRNNPRTILLVGYLARISQSERSLNLVAHAQILWAFLALTTITLGLSLSPLLSQWSLLLRMSPHRTNEGEGLPQFQVVQPP